MEGGVPMKLLGFCYVALAVMLAVAIIRKAYITKQDPDEVFEDFFKEIFKFFV